MMNEEIKNEQAAPEPEPVDTVLPQENAAEEITEETQSSQPETSRLTSRLGNLTLRLGLGILLVAVVAFLAYWIWQRVRIVPHPDTAPAISGGGSASLDGDNSPVALQPFATPLVSLDNGIPRQIQLLTTFPNRPRVSVITYTVQTGDNLFAIAANFGLKAETLLWSNYPILKDNPHMLAINQVLFIPPVDGAYYQWKEGDTLASVAAYYQVDPQAAILDYPGNHFDLTKSQAEAYGLKPGDWLIIKGGKRPIKDWGPPAISRANPAAARYYGDGYCGKVYQGAIGTGTFIWPTVSHIISGYNYSAIHPAIDIGGVLGSPIVASDSGVVVFAGWSNYGYGNLIVIDHGNGFQTAYAHLSAIAVGCGQSVFQGSYIGALGSTGNSTGPHCHFEISYNGAKPNPLDYLP